MKKHTLLMLSALVFTLCLTGQVHAASPSDDGEQQNNNRTIETGNFTCTDTRMSCSDTSREQSALVQATNSCLQEQGSSSTSVSSFSSSGGNLCATSSKFMNNLGTAMWYVCCVIPVAAQSETCMVSCKEYGSNGKR